MLQQVGHCHIDSELLIRPENAIRPTSCVESLNRAFFGVGSVRVFASSIVDCVLILIYSVECKLESHPVENGVPEAMWTGQAQYTAFCGHCHLPRWKN